MATTTKLAALVGVLAIAITSCSPPTTSSVPAVDTETAPTAVADITGPIPVTAESGEPFRGASEQPVAGPGLPLPVLVSYGYVEEEYFVSGTVGGKPYSTALLVRKPQDPARFSGLVAVETIHAAGAIPLWGSRDVWLAGNHGWVAVASQRTALESHVKQFNPERYATLEVPEAAAPAGAPAADARVAQDLVSQEIMTQVGALLKRNADHGPFAGMTVRHLIMGGASQTGGTTLRYIEHSHARARLADGDPIYDGYLPSLSLPSRPVAGGDAAVVHAVAEGDLERALERGWAPSALRPDADAPDDRYRHYQIVGASHVGTRGVTDPLEIFPTLANVMEPGDQLSQFPNGFSTAATYDLVAWVTEGVAPPKAPVIEIADGEIVRDEFGNAKGGVRSPYVDMPTARYMPAARGLIGLQEPIPADRLQSLYGSKAEYLERFNAEIDELVAQRWLLPEAGERLKAEEAERPPF